MAEGADIRWRGTERLAFDGLVDRRGHREHDWQRIEAPLVRNLLASGLARPHATGFGIDATPDGRVIGATGVVRESGPWVLRCAGSPGNQARSPSSAQATATG